MDSKALESHYSIPSFCIDSCVCVQGLVSVCVQVRADVNLGSAVSDESVLC